MTAGRLATGIAIVWSLAVIVALIALADPMKPALRGTSDEFWSAAARVSPRGSMTYGGSALFEGDNCYYVPVTLDASWLHKVDRAEVMRDWPTVLAIWDGRAAAGANSDYFIAAYNKFRGLPIAQQDPEHLKACMDEANEARLIAEFPTWSRAGETYSQLQTKWIQQVAGRSRRYWMNFLFEFALLGGLGWFLLWPMIRGLSLLRSWVHFLFAPFFFLLPAWLGYCSFVVTGAGPAGGIVYPWLLMVVQRMRIEPAWDYPILYALPKVLEGINQSPAISWDEREEFKSWVALPPGSLEALIAGIVLCGLFLLYRFMMQELQRKRLRRTGFEVLPGSSNAATHGDAT